MVLGLVVRRIEQEYPKRSVKKVDLVHSHPNMNPEPMRCDTKSCVVLLPCTVGH